MATRYDVFNGDADGLCALQQLRRTRPVDTILITGLKRDIRLLHRVKVEPGDEITVLDVSLDKNRSALDQMLTQGAKVFYVDHHFPGELPKHDNLDLRIDPSAGTCTSLMMNQYLTGHQAQWAVVGAFGDHCDAAATTLGQSIGLTTAELATYKQLGVCLNYNSYGFELDDLLFHPADLYRLLSRHNDPGDFIQNEPGYAALKSQYEEDMASAEQVKAASATESGAIYLLPNTIWAKRTLGVLGNQLAKQFPHRAHALLVDMGDEHYRVSVRAPYSRQSGADTVCRQFASGGGRKAAAGINRLPANRLPQFSDQFNRAF